MVRRSKPLTTSTNVPIESMDTVRTGKGRVEITFVDKTTVKITEQSKLVIDEFVYDANPKKSKMGLKFASGTIRFATGTGIAKNRINLKTPSATIAVRGTDFTSTVDEFGKSLIILLPEANGTVGEITVSNSAGEVVLNKAFQATMVATWDTPPTTPVILNLTIDMIDNMLIISPPDDVKAMNSEMDKRANILDLSELDVDYLKNDDLEKDNFKDTIDIQQIDSNYLQDMLDDGLDTKSEEKNGVKIEGTKIGADTKTQIYTIVESDTVRLVRTVNNYQEFLVPSNQGKTISINDSGKINNVIINDGGSSINVIQKN